MKIYKNILIGIIFVAIFGFNNVKGYGKGAITVGLSTDNVDKIGNVDETASILAIDTTINAETDLKLNKDVLSKNLEKHEHGQQNVYSGNHEIAGVTKTNSEFSLIQGGEINIENIDKAVHELQSAVKDIAASGGKGSFEVHLHSSGADEKCSDITCNLQVGDTVKNIKNKEIDGILSTEEHHVSLPQEAYINTALHSSNIVKEMSNTGATEEHHVSLPQEAYINTALHSSNIVKEMSNTGANKEHLVSSPQEGYINTGLHSSNILKEMSHTSANEEHHVSLPQEAYINTALHSSNIVKEMPNTGTDLNLSSEKHFALNSQESEQHSKNLETESLNLGIHTASLGMSTNIDKSINTFIGDNIGPILKPNSDIPENQIRGMGSPNNDIVISTSAAGHFSQEAHDSKHIQPQKVPNEEINIDITKQKVPEFPVGNSYETYVGYPNFGPTTFGLSQPVAYGNAGAFGGYGSGGYGFQINPNFFGRHPGTQGFHFARGHRGHLSNGGFGSFTGHPNYHIGFTGFGAGIPESGAEIPNNGQFSNGVVPGGLHGNSYDNSNGAHVILGMSLENPGFQGAPVQSSGELLNQGIGTPGSQVVLDGQNSGIKATSSISSLEIEAINNADSQIHKNTELGGVGVHAHESVQPSIASDSKFIHNINAEENNKGNIGFIGEKGGQKKIAHHEHHAIHKTIHKDGNVMPVDNHFQTNTNKVEISSSLPNGIHVPGAETENHAGIGVFGENSFGAYGGLGLNHERVGFGGYGAVPLRGYNGNHGPPHYNFRSSFLSGVGGYGINPLNGYNNGGIAIPSKEPIINFEGGKGYGGSYGK